MLATSINHFQRIPRLFSFNQCAVKSSITDNIIPCSDVGGALMLCGVSCFQLKENTD